MTDFSKMSDAELEQMAAQQTLAQPPVTNIPGYAAPFVAPVLPFAATYDMMRGKTKASPVAEAQAAPVPAGPFPDIPITTAPPPTNYDPTYNPDPNFAAQRPVASEVQGFLSRMASGLGGWASGRPLGFAQSAAEIARSPTSQMLPLLTNPATAPFSAGLLAMKALGGNFDSQALEQAAAEKRQTDQPLKSTWGGRVGMAAGPVLAAAAGGASLPGVVASSGLIGTTDPLGAGESRGLDVSGNIAGAILGRAAGKGLSRWASHRADEPLMGWTRSNANQAFADTLSAKSSAPEDILARRDEMGAIFDTYRNPNVIAQIPQGTARTVDEAASELATVDPERFKNLPLIQRVLAFGKQGNATTEQLGDLSSEIGKKIFKTNNPELADAYSTVQDYLHERILSTLSGPDAAIYEQTMRQYSMLKNVVPKPSLYNAATGDVNLEGIGRMLQSKDTWGYLGRTDSPLYQAARAGQAEKLTGKMPGGIVEKLKYMAVHNPATAVTAGTSARFLSNFPTLLPAAVQAGGAGLGGGLAGNFVEKPPEPLPYLER